MQTGQPRQFFEGRSEELILVFDKILTEVADLPINGIFRKNSDIELCKESSLALRDAIEVLSGKWKFCILLNRRAYEIMRFKNLQENVVGISPKVLSKELQELEQNLLLIRTVKNTKPVTVSYSLTKFAIETQPVLSALIEFGIKHGKVIKRK